MLVFVLWLLLCGVITQHRTCNASYTYTRAEVTDDAKKNTTYTAEFWVSQQITPTTMDIAAWASLSDLAIIGDLTGDGVDEIALGNTALACVAVVSLKARTSKDKADTTAVQLMRETFISAAGKGTSFGKDITALRYDFNGDSFNDIAVSAPAGELQDSVWADGRLVIIGLDNKLAVTYQHVYTAAEWCPGCSGSSAEGPFATDVMSYKVTTGGTAKYCVVTASGWMAPDYNNGIFEDQANAYTLINCGMNKDNTAIAGPNVVTSIKLNQFYQYKNYQYFKNIAVLGDLDDDGTEEIVDMSTWGATQYYINYWKCVPPANCQEWWEVGYNLQAAFVPVATGAAGDMNGDGIPDVLVFVADTIITFFLSNKGVGLGLQTIAVLGDAPKTTVAVSRGSTIDSIYAYYGTDTLGGVSAINLGRKFLAGEHPTGMPAVPEIAPEEPPAEPPVEAPEEPPVEPPTEPPVEPPTEPPVEAPTEPPVEAPTEAPTEPPTEAPMEAPTEPPTEPPAEPPVEPPTEPPTKAPAEPPAVPSTPPAMPPVVPPAVPVAPPLVLPNINLDDLIADNTVRQGNGLATIEMVQQPVTDAQKADFAKGDNVNKWFFTVRLPSVMTAPTADVVLALTSRNSRLIITPSTIRWVADSNTTIVQGVTARLVGTAGNKMSVQAFQNLAAMDADFQSADTRFQRFVSFNLAADNIAVAPPGQPIAPRVVVAPATPMTPPTAPQKKKGHGGRDVAIGVGVGVGGGLLLIGICIGLIVFVVRKKQRETPMPPDWGAAGAQHSPNWYPPAGFSGGQWIAPMTASNAQFKLGYAQPPNTPQALF